MEGKGKEFEVERHTVTALTDWRMAGHSQATLNCSITFPICFIGSTDSVTPRQQIFLSFNKESIVGFAKNQGKTVVGFPL